MNKESKAYLRAYAGAILCIIFINVLFWVPSVIAGPAVGRIFGVTPESGIELLRSTLNLVIGFFVFKAVVRTDLIPHLKKIAEDATKE